MSFKKDDEVVVKINFGRFKKGDTGKVAKVDGDMLWIEIGKSGVWRRQDDAHHVIKKK